ncbi:hypothetical protein AAKU67_001306 [Oxalobacteraceae bacterium GrIS 2.11]
MDRKKQTGRSIEELICPIAGHHLVLPCRAKQLEAKNSAQALCFYASSAMDRKKQTGRSIEELICPIAGHHLVCPAGQNSLKLKTVRRHCFFYASSAMDRKKQTGRSIEELTCPIAGHHLVLPCRAKQLKTKKQCAGTVFLLKAPYIAQLTIQSAFAFQFFSPTLNSTVPVAVQTESC